MWEFFWGKNVFRKILWKKLLVKKKFVEEKLCAHKKHVDTFLSKEIMWKHIHVCKKNLFKLQNKILWEKNSDKPLISPSPVNSRIFAL